MTAEYTQSNFTDAELDHIRQQGEAERQRNIGFRPAAITSTRQEITFRNGQVVEQTSINKSAGERTAYVRQPEPGMIEIQGIKTSVDAAKAAGLIPANWQEGQSLPFDRAPTQGAQKAPQSEPLRVCRRLQLLSRMEHHEQDDEQVFPRGA